MIRKVLALSALLMGVVQWTVPARAADRMDAAVAHAGRPASDLKRDPIDHPADVLRLTGMTAGMTVADVLAGDGYYSELASYVVGPSGKVVLINNAAFDKWSEGLAERIANNRLPNVQHLTVDLNNMQLAAASVDVVLLVKVYHDMYWIDTEGNWPKVDVGSVLDQLNHALKPGGLLLLEDHSAAKGHGKNDAGSLHRVEEDFALKDFKAHGFKLVDKSDLVRMPKDPRDQITYKGPMVGKTDRFILVFRKA